MTIPPRLAYLAAAALALGAGLFLLFVVLALGLVGVEGDPFDRVYAGVLAVGLIGAVVARLRAAGMARALVAMALAQAMVMVVALVAGKHASPVTSVAELVGLHAMFIVLFLGSAWLFRLAARGRARQAG